MSQNKYINFNVEERNKNKKAKPKTYHKTHNHNELIICNIIMFYINLIIPFNMTSLFLYMKFTCQY